MEIALTLTGTLEEISNALVALGHSTPDGLPVRESWTPTAAETLVTRITEGARAPLRYQCEHAPEASIDAFLEATGMDANHVGGVNTSVSSQVERLGLPRFIESDYNRRVWRVDPIVAKLILDAFDRIEASA